LASYLAELRITKRNISATILADVKRFFHQINTDEVFGTHRHQRTREPEACPFFEPPFTVQTIFRPEAPMPAYPQTKNGVPLLAWRGCDPKVEQARVFHGVKGCTGCSYARR
jgi:dTDP-D-glucose 4,6-dehydratase